ncbi:MAG: transglycosylase domain-containing protein, partial [Bacteroidales bacterium]|nr:transglycosylase domain-containing protein [Bacteroidales bacterium]
KGFEAYFTFLIEKIWGKRRILEVYLNVAEMGKGIYGAEAAAERLFHTRAYKLNKIQGAAIAACLPNPIKRKANAPTKYLSGRISNIVKEVYRTPVPDFLREEK